MLVKQLGEVGTRKTLAREKGVEEFNARKRQSSSKRCYPSTS